MAVYLIESFNKALTVIANNIKVAGPSYRGDRYPEYDPLQINESKFDDTLRFKNYEITADGDTINVEWISQDIPEEFTVLDDFYKEVIRAIKTNLKKNNYKDSVEVNIHISDRYDTFDDNYQITIS